MLYCRFHLCFVLSSVDKNRWALFRKTNDIKTIPTIGIETTHNECVCVGGGVNLTTVHSVLSKIQVAKPPLNINKTLLISARSPRL